MIYMIDLCGAKILEFNSIEQAKEKTRSSFIHPDDTYPSFDVALAVMKGICISDRKIILRDLSEAQSTLAQIDRGLKYVEKEEDRRTANKRDRRRSSSNTKGSRKGTKS
jgi:hypothetical protein